MRTVYILNVQMTGSNGGVIHFVDEVFLDADVAIEQQRKMDETYKDDLNYMSYICGPVLLNEKKGSDLA